MSDKKIKVAHIVPGMVFGGVEVAILKSHSYLNECFEYDVFYVRKKGQLNVDQKSVFNFLLKMNRYDLVITSLWWSHIFGLLGSIFGVKWVTFIHSTGSASILDYYITRNALKFCNKIIFDSQATKTSFSINYKASSFIVPYIFPSTNKSISINNSPSFDLLWVGRNSSEKRLDLLVSLIKSIEKYSKGKRYCVCIAGPEYSPIDEMSKALNGRLQVHYNIDPDKVIEFNCCSKIVVCMSDYEGFSVTTAEAALHGCIVAARRVGDLPNYLCNESTVWLDDIGQNSWDSFIYEIVKILDNDKLYKKLRELSQTYTRAALQGESYFESMEKTIRHVYDAD